MAFVFEAYEFDTTTSTARFKYAFTDGRRFEETVAFSKVAETMNTEVLDRALRLAFLVTGTSYAKTFPTTEVQLPFAIDQWTADFLNAVYQEGLSQFAYENNLTRADLPHFVATGEHAPAAEYEGSGAIALQSGGKDSLLTDRLLRDKGIEYVPWYLASGESHPAVLDTLTMPLVTARRTIDRDALSAALRDGGRNGHVPVTYIVQSLALIQAVLLNKRDVYVSIAHEGEEPHAHIGDLSITHQWSKTWAAEQLFQHFVRRSIAESISVGSPLRSLSELRVAELFAERCWDEFGHRFSSCNRANYTQGADNTTLTWCGDCPKCANSYLLFAPYVEATELQSLFHGQDLYQKPSLQETFKGLLGVDGVMKPFECVGEIDELRFAYHASLERGGYGHLSFDVPSAQFSPLKRYPANDWLRLV